MSLRAGSLNRIITIERPTGGGYGEPKGWAVVAEGVRASILMLSGAATIKSDAVTSNARASIRVRWREDVQAGMRVMHNGKAYMVQVVLPDMQGRRHIDLVCEVTDAGN